MLLHCCYEILGFKCEWGTVKDGYLYIGGHGKNSYKKGVTSKHEKFIKKISDKGEVMHIDWTDNFEKIEALLGIENPGKFPLFFIY